MVSIDSVSGDEDVHTDFYRTSCGACEDGAHCAGLLLQYVTRKLSGVVLGM